MMVIDWVILGVIIAAAGAAAWVVSKHWKKLMLIDVEAMPVAKLHSRKQQLIESRLIRKAASFRTHMAAVVHPFTQRVSRLLRMWQHKLVALEHKYRQADQQQPQTQEEREMTRQKVASLLERGAQLFNEGNYGEAETVFLDVVRLNPKEVEAYEYLGEVYMEKKEYEHAIQTLEFARSLNPNDDRIYYDLGRVYQTQQDWKKALEYFRVCVELMPNNPKNLHGLLQASIEAGDRFRARETLRRLKQADPDNQKLAELEEAVNRV